MKFLTMLALGLCFSFHAFAGGGGAVGQKFVKQIYLKGTSASAGNGSSYDAPLPFVDGNLWAIPCGALIDRVYVVVDTVITGTSDLDIGDDDSSNGYVDGSASVTLGTTGAYGFDAKNAGSYLRIQTAGATDAGDIYVVPNSKYYKAAGKTLKLDVTGSNTAGRARVVIEGLYAGCKS